VDCLENEVLGVFLFTVVLGVLADGLGEALDRFLEDECSSSSAAAFRSKAVGFLVRVLGLLPSLASSYSYERSV
jgi:Na+/H+-dicarboxylate symporter